MPANPPEDMPRISPYLLYEDVAAGEADLLLRHARRRPEPDRAVTHAPIRRPAPLLARPSA
ncbi:MAG: hypothetical protein JRH19_27620 [Deltaproteobacteria bacterium]|nr:hypothetical protein [Deltaproteobacteria bacterium]